jgi:hypothetical protein
LDLIKALLQVEQVVLRLQVLNLLIPQAPAQPLAQAQALPQDKHLPLQLLPHHLWHLAESKARSCQAWQSLVLSVRESFD